MGSWARFFLSMLLLMGSIGVVSCASKTDTFVATVGIDSPLNSPIATPSIDKVSLPPNEELLDSWVGDLNADGRGEFVIAAGDDSANVDKIYVFGGSDALQPTLLQEIELPESGGFHRLMVVDLDLDGMQDIGVYEERSNDSQFELFVFRSQEDSFVLSSPKGGVLEGETGFVSLAEPPVIEDVDQEGGLEIIVFVEGASEGYLASRAYSWDGEAFSFADYLYLPGRKRP